SLFCFFCGFCRPPRSTLFPTRRSSDLGRENSWRVRNCEQGSLLQPGEVLVTPITRRLSFSSDGLIHLQDSPWPGAYQPAIEAVRSEEHTSELQSRENLVCRLLLEKKNT